MTKFLAGIVVAAIKALLQDKDFTQWVDGRIASVLASFEKDTEAYVENMEANLLRDIEALPERIIGSTEHTVESLVGGLPPQIKDEINPLFDGFTNLLRSFNINIPGLPNIFPWGNK